MPEIDLSEYTHSKLIARGYTRVVHKEYPGWVTYEPVTPGGGWFAFSYTKERPKVGFAGNDATMNNWIEEVSCWKIMHPDIYAWWIDPKQRAILTKFNEVLIKSEDPLIKEGQNGSSSSESGL